MIRILSSLALSLLELFDVKDIVAEDTVVDALLFRDSFECVRNSIIKKVEINQDGRYNCVYKYLICKKNRYLRLDIASAPVYAEFFMSLMTLDPITGTLWVRAFIVTNY